MTNTNLKNSKTFFYLFLALTFVAAFWLLKGYFVMIIMGFLIFFVFDPVYKFILKYLNNKSISSFITVLIIILCVLIPTILVGNLLVDQTKEFNKDLNRYIKNEESETFILESVSFSDIVEKTNETLATFPGDMEITEDQARKFVEDNFLTVSEFLASQIFSAGIAAVNFLPDLLLFLMLIGFLFPAQEKLFKFLRDLSPLDDEIDNLYIRRFKLLSKSLLLGNFVIALIQSILTGVSLWIVGVDYVVFWVILMAFVGLLPLGVGLVSQPIAVILMLTGNFWEGLFVFLFYTLLVSNLDNFLRPQLVNKEANLHPILVLLGVLAGIKVFGFLGVFVGPIILIFLITNLEVYSKYYKKVINDNISNGDDKRVISHQTKEVENHRKLSNHIKSFPT